MEILPSSARRMQHDFASADAVAGGIYVAFYLGSQLLVWAVTKGDKNLIQDEEFCGWLACAFRQVWRIFVDYIGSIEFLTKFNVIVVNI